MFKRRRLLLITFLLALVVLNKVHAYHGEDNNDDVDNEDYNYYDNYYNEHYEGDGCKEDKEDIQDLKDLEEIVRLLGSKEVSPNGISRIDGQDLISNNTCSSKGMLNNVFRRFSGIIFEDMAGVNGMSSGPLAVKGDFMTSTFSANFNDGADCSNHDSLDAYALVVNGFTDIKQLSVNGDVFTNGGNKTDVFTELGQQCSISEKKGTGLVNFDELEVEANKLNNLYRDHPPTLQILEDGSLKELANADQGIHYFTFNTCGDSSTCEKIAKGQLSDSKQIFFGKDWNGIKGYLPDDSMTYVFNLPVIENTDINITTSRPTALFNMCKLVWNFYPVKLGTGEYSPTGAFIFRKSVDVNINGLVLLPRGKIIEETFGYFFGQVIALSYTWVGDLMQSILHYRYSIETCTSFDGCIPDPPAPIVSTTPFATITERYTVTNNVEVTRTVTATLKTDGTATVTSTKDHFTTITNCDPDDTCTHHFHHIHDENCEDEDDGDDGEYSNDIYKKKLYHKKYNEVDDDCYYDN